MMGRLGVSDDFLSILDVVELKSDDTCFSLRCIGVNITSVSGTRTDDEDLLSTSRIVCATRVRGFDSSLRAAGGDVSDTGFSGNVFWVAVGLGWRISLRSRLCGGNLSKSSTKASFLGKVSETAEFIDMPVPKYLRSVPVVAVPVLPTENNGRECSRGAGTGC